MRQGDSRFFYERDSKVARDDRFAAVFDLGHAHILSANRNDAHVSDFGVRFTGRRCGAGLTFKSGIFVRILKVAKNRVEAVDLYSAAREVNVFTVSVLGIVWGVPPA